MRCPECGAELAPNSLRCKKCRSVKTTLMQVQLPCTEDIAQSENRHEKITQKELSSRARVSGLVKPLAPRTKDNEIPVVSYLLCHPFQPIKLAQDKNFGIGRDESNQLRLPSWEVSRFHASIYWQDNSYVIKDLDSANGTFVDEDYVDVYPLKDGHKINIGTHTIIYREVPKGTIPYMHMPDLSLKDTLKINLHKGRSESLLQQTSFSGDVKTIGLFSILQMLGADRKSGCLKIVRQQKTSRIYFLEGDVVHSVSGELQGREAFFDAMREDQGKFEFSPDNAPEEVTMSERVEWLLLEGARLIDEDEDEDEDD